jgi:hypothetical protein
MATKNDAPVEVWPDRESWIADAGHFVQTRCYAHQRVSNLATDYLDDAADVSFDLHSVRRQITRLIRALLDGDASVGDASVEAVGRLGSELRFLSEKLEAAVRRRDCAAKAAEDAAVLAEQQRRLTDEAWFEELERRAQCDAYQDPAQFIHRAT